ncbi:MAG: hypothetical protein OEW89_10490 [Gammaproteobacteria bacterium]|nr:hypothetical protein [Gammaproteobacteria bacterium]MDH5593333.1 hypothetical protein [Gammaproteobacteria bacterium]MDH5614762.1 hypothetical protein [Gammaproteobacteria bacterium]
MAEGDVDIIIEFSEKGSAVRVMHGKKLLYYSLEQSPMHALRKADTYKAMHERQGFRVNIIKEKAYA